MSRSPTFVATGVLLVAAACGPSDRSAEIFLAALNGIPSEAFQGREVEVNPLLLEESFPRIPEEVLEVFRREGFTVSEESDRAGQASGEDAAATVFFTAPDTTGPGEYQLGAAVTLGRPFGRLNRGDTWWRVRVDCPGQCAVVEVAKSGYQEWGHIGR